MQVAAASLGSIENPNPFSKFNSVLTTLNDFLFFFEHVNPIITTVSRPVDMTGDWAAEKKTRVTVLKGVGLPNAEYGVAIAQMSPSHVEVRGITVGISGLSMSVMIGHLV
jgi:hypothetical protein